MARAWRVRREEEPFRLPVERRDVDSTGRDGKIRISYLVTPLNVNSHNLFSESENDGTNFPNHVKNHRLLYLLGFCACILSHCSIDPGFLCFFGVDFLRA